MVEETHQAKPRLAIVGSSGFIGSSLCREVASDYETIAITRSPHRAAEGSPGSPVRWLACDFFSRADLFQALDGANLVVYLAHTRVPTARLDQARCSDMDVLQADNCALAAAHHGVRQIIYLSGLLPEGNVSPQMLQSRNEVETVLGSYGTPVTVLRTSLIAGPGSSAVSFLIDVVRRLPVIPIPDWGQTRRQPIALYDVLRAVIHCLDNQETFNGSYDIGGPEVMSTAEIFHQVALRLGKKRKVFVSAALPRRVYTMLLRVLSPSTHPGLINLFVEGIQHDTLVGENQLQRLLLQDARHLRTTLEEASEISPNIPQNNPRHVSLRKDQADFERASTVRSIQRVKRPSGRNAHWVSDYYFSWLSRYVWPFIRSMHGEDGNWQIGIKGTSLNLLVLSYAASHSSDHRILYFITGGLLARASGKSRDRMEFRDLKNEDSTIIAIHDFTPNLPWGFYSLTQGVMHGWIMRRFQKHLERYCRSSVTKLDQ